MSAKIKISYTTEEELEEITRPLSSLVRNWKKQPEKGKYKRAYGTLSRERSPEELREMGRKGGIASGKSRVRKETCKSWPRCCLISRYRSHSREW